MPTFTASGRMSEKTASICSPKNSGVTSMIEVTPRVFCAVRAVMALVPNTPFACIVLRSACTPAPPLESEPAIVSAQRTPSSMRRVRTRRSCAARRTSGRANNALMVATPTIPVPASSRTLSRPMPPIATTGIETAAQIAASVSQSTSSASSLEPVGKTAPTPR